MNPEPIRHRRRALQLIAAAVIAIGLTAPLDASVDAWGGGNVTATAPDPTEPPPDEPSDSTEAEETPEGAETPLEPGGVAAPVWIGAVLVLVLAVTFAVKAANSSPASVD